MTKSDREKKAALIQLAERYPWLAMYAASFATTRSEKGGRPSTVFPRSSFSLRLTSGESKLVDEWQVTFSNLLGKTPSRGETVGLLAWLARERYQEVLEQQAEPPDSLEELLKLFKGV